MSEIKVPPLGESVTEATVGTWHKKEGDAVKEDELLVELETDKITLEVNAESSGVLQSIKVNTGTTVAVGDVLGSVKEGAAASSSSAEKDAGENKQEEEKTKPKTPAADKAEKKVPSPAAGRLAAEKNIGLDQLSGSGKDGRITKGDVMAAEQKPGKDGSSSGDRVSETVKMTKLRQRIAERLKESQNTAAILTTFNEIDMSGVMAIRNAYKDKFVEKYQVKLGFMSFFVKAAVVALQEIPEINAQINSDEIIYHKYCDIGIAVGTDKGLVVPVLRDADKLSFAEIESGIADLAKKARDNKLTMEDLTGGTFSITNGGIYGSLLSTPIINPPQSAILGMHSINERPMAIKGEVKIRPMMYTALSYDHRLVDGKGAVTFLVRLKELLESPERLLFRI